LAVELRNEDELKVGTVLDGVITNVAKFGAFVDIGGDQDGLVHLSQLPLDSSKDIESAFKAGDTVSVRIVSLAEDGKRISLSMRDPREAAPRQRPGGGDRFQRSGPG
jgi:predicted RNA-binding protein with RPS1 domain